MKKYIIQGGLAVFISIIIYQTYSISSIKKELIGIQSMNFTLQQQIDTSIGNISSGIQNTLYDELGKSHITKDVNFKFESNGESGYDLTVRAELRELKNQSKVIFMYKDKESGNWDELELEKMSELSYIGKFILPYDKTFEYKVVIKGDMSESGDVEIIDKYTFIPEAPTVSVGYSETEWYLTAYPSNYYDDKDQNQIEKIDAIVGYGGKEKAYKYEHKEENIYGENNTVEGKNIFYEVAIPKKDNNNKLDYVKMKVTYDNGMIDTVDVTENLVE